MKILSLSVTLLLFVIAMIHILWGQGIWWPVRDEAELARTVVGAKGLSAMPSPLACFSVAIALMVIASLSLILGHHVVTDIFPRWLVSLLALAASLVFLLRGLVGYTAVWMDMTPEDPFRTYDMWVYSPLCIFLGLSLFILLKQYRAITA